MHYHIRVQGHLDPSWQHRFEGLQIKHEGSGTTLLSGPLPDQAALLLSITGSLLLWERSSPCSSVVAGSTWIL